MKTSRAAKASLFVTLGLALCGIGCSTITFGSAGATSSRGWLAGHAKQYVFARADDGSDDRLFVAVESQTDAQLRTADGAIVPVENLRRVIARDRAQGALDGLPIGAIAGFTSGLASGLIVLVALKPDPDCFGCYSPGSGEVFALSGVGLLIGAAIGAGIGALIGHADVLELK
jgi:hypothetical protein